MPTLRKSNKVKGLIRQKQHKPKPHIQAEQQSSLNNSITKNNKLTLTDELLKSWILDYNGATSTSFDKQQKKQETYHYVTQVDTCETFISDSGSSSNSNGDAIIRRFDSNDDSKDSGKKLSDEKKCDNNSSKETVIKTDIANENKVCSVNRYLLNCSIDIDDDNISSSSSSYSQQDEVCASYPSESSASESSASESSASESSSISSYSSSNCMIRTSRKGKKIEKQSKQRQKSSLSKKKSNNAFLPNKIMNLLYCSNKNSDGSSDNKNNTFIPAVLSSNKEQNKIQHIKSSSNNDDKEKELRTKHTSKESFNMQSYSKQMKQTEEDYGDHHPIGASIEEIQAINESIQILTDLNKNDDNVWKIKSNKIQNRQVTVHSNNDIIKKKKNKSATRVAI